MKKFAKPAAGIAAMIPFACGCGQQEAQPNIVFFLVDDMGWVDSSVQYGEVLYPNNLRFNTPNMQRLSERSLVMENAYAQAVSTPTRTSIMTGMNSAHSHITNWTSAFKDTPSDASGGAISMSNGKSSGNAAEGDVLSRPEWNINGISPVPGVENTQYETSMVQLLKDAGYFTVHVGKAHFAPAGTPGTNPYNHGFCVNIAGSMAGQPRDYLSELNYGNVDERRNDFAVQNLCEYYGSGTHLTEALTREALKAIDYPISHKQPFYLYMAHYATHTPIQPDDRYAQKYRDAGMDEGEARYASMVEGVDKSLGDIMDFLDSKGLSDNTIIIFMTDNGGNAENVQKGGIPHTQNLPLREGKGSCYEGGVRVPMMFCWPGKGKTGRCETPVICEDLYPTILHMAGLTKYETVQEIDGVDLVPMITGSGEGPDYERPLIFHYPHKWKSYRNNDVDFISAIRMGDWKLVYRISTQELELYNLKEDIGETCNLAAEHPEIVSRLAGELSGKLEKWDSPMPIVIESGEKAPLPVNLL